MKRSDKDIIKEGMKATLQLHGCILNRESRLILEERIRVIEWLYGLRDELYSVEGL